MTLLLQIYFLGTALLLMISVYMVIFNDLTISLPGLNGKLSKAKDFLRAIV